MTTNWNPDGPFHIGINMAGAISAGAYTAGVLDFFTEALDEWYAAKAVAGAAVPHHDVVIDILTGASAGGMCAAISSVMLQGPFQHIDNAQADPYPVNTTNRFYESWVNKIDIIPLLGTKDLAGGNVISLLDSSIIDEIADYALAPGATAPQPYLSPSLTLFLTLTNVRGVPYSISGDASGSSEETIDYYADRLQFETTHPGVPQVSKYAKPLPIGSGGGDWKLLNVAAKATGAFPIFLAPRQIPRTAGDYATAPWQPIDSGDPTPTPPKWPLADDATFTTLNIDGGMTDNDPFELAHDFLAVQNPLAQRDPNTGELNNPADANKANCAVLTVAPFPADQVYDPKYDFGKNSSILGMLPNLFTVLISQSRFQGETLEAVMRGTSFSRFVLAPSDAANKDKDALQCALLGAFGGFFDRGFRAHDYALGRRNCQQFLREHFRLAVDNPIIAAGLKNLDDATRTQVIAQFQAQSPDFVQIIPLCGKAAIEVPEPTRATITQARVDQILDLVIARLHAVSGPILATLFSGFGDFAAKEAVNVLISTVGKPKIKALLQANLKDVISG